MCFSIHIKAKFVNPDKGHKLQNCIFLWQEVKKISRKYQLAVVVIHPDLKSVDDVIELHTVKQWSVFDKEGNKDYLFDVSLVVEQDREPEGPKEAQRERVPPVMLELGAQMGRMNYNEVTTFAMTTNVNNYNTPAPENIPWPNKQPTNGIFGEWGHYGVCERRRLNGDESNVRIKKFPAIANPTMLQIF